MDEPTLSFSSQWEQSRNVKRSFFHLSFIVPKLVNYQSTKSFLQGNSRQLVEESSGLEKILYEMKEVEKTLNLLLNSRKEEGKPGYWTRMTKTINKVFFICYVTVACLFLVVIFTMWINAQDE